MGQHDLIRDPADWARESGWISRRRAENMAARLDALAATIGKAPWADTRCPEWAKELQSISKKLAPPKKAATMLEP